MRRMFNILVMVMLAIAGMSSCKSECKCFKNSYGNIAPKHQVEQSA
jgi:hypothetical protein